MKLVFILATLLLSISASAQPRAQLPCDLVENPSISFSSDSSRVLAFAGDEYWVWDVATQQAIAHATVVELMDASLSPDGTSLALGSRPRRLEVLNLSSGQSEFQHLGAAVSVGQDSGGYASCFSPEADYLMVWGIGYEREANEPWAYQFAWPAGSLLRKYEISSGGGRCYWSADGKLMIDKDYHTIEIRQPKTGALLESIQAYSRSGHAPIEERFGILEQREVGERIDFTRAPIGFAAQALWQGGGVIFYPRGRDTPIGALELALSPTLSPDGRTLAVLIKGGILLLDVSATLSSVESDRPALVPAAKAP